MLKVCFGCLQSHNFDFVKILCFMIMYDFYLNFSGELMSKSLLVILYYFIRFHFYISELNILRGLMTLVCRKALKTNLQKIEISLTHWRCIPLLDGLMYQGHFDVEYLVLTNYISSLLVSN